MVLSRFLLYASSNVVFIQNNYLIYNYDVTKKTLIKEAQTLIKFD